MLGITAGQMEQRGQKAEVIEQLDMVDNLWLNADEDQRPPNDKDSRDRRSSSWQGILGHLEKNAQLYLGGEEGTVLAEVRKLLVWICYCAAQI